MDPWEGLSETASASEEKKLVSSNLRSLLSRLVKRLHNVLPLFMKSGSKAILTNPKI